MSTNGKRLRQESSQREPLAIIGIACRFPGNVWDAESFWELLSSGRSGIGEVPADRWNRDRYYHRDTAIPNRMHSKWGGFVDALDGFDARFWGISPREAARMDPQQRWLLEVAWEAVEDAGIPPSRLGGTNTGVFVGISSSDYAQIQMTNHFGLDVHSNSGNTLSIASNRISYSLDLKGPSVSVDTACSSSLVAVWLACRSIWDGTCQAALVGGSNAVIVPSTTMAFSKATMLSPDGQCFAFDSRANGYVRGDGAAVVLIKKAADALRDGDRIYAVIRAAVANQDGKTSSMMVPSVHGQSDMLEQAYREAGIAPGRVSYVEAHGTGTPLGDPIEATALGNVLSRGREPGHPCLVGSVKTNIGHLEAGSGMAGLIKAVMILHKGLVPPNRNFLAPNPGIPFQRLQLEVPTDLRPLPVSHGDIPVAAVNSFGFGGTNAHVVLEAAPVRTAPRAPRAPARKAERPCLLPISARDDNALHEYIKRYRRLLRDESIPLAELCFAAGARKEQHPQRVAVVGRTHDELRERLSLWLSNPDEAAGVVAGTVTGHSHRCTFVFTGQGPQWWGMGQQLLAQEPVFRSTIETIDRLFARLADWSLLEEMNRTEATSQIDQTHIAQPAIFGLQVALAELWRSWGIEPACVIGHSVGEVAAAYCAGIYSLDDAVRIAYHRSRLQHSTRGTGRMLAAGISAAEARQRIQGWDHRVHLSAINSPNLITLSGDTEPLEQIAQQLKEDDKFFRWLGIDYAFHSHQMDPIRAELLSTLAEIHPQPGTIPFYSTVTGGLLLGEKLDAQYWWKNVRLPVLFAPALMQMIRAGADLFVEVGPHPSLHSSMEDCLAACSSRGAVYHSLRRNSDEAQELMTNLAGLYVRGVPVDWAAINQASGQFLPLPTYPWTHESHWIESSESSRNRMADEVHPLLGLPQDAIQPTWEFLLDPRLFPYIRDHQIWGSIVFPAAGYGEIGLALAHELYPDQPHVVECIEIKKALFAFDDKITTVRVVADQKDKSFAVYSATGDQHDWELNAQGRLTPLVTERPDPIALEPLRASMDEYIDHEQYYAELVAAGYGFGPNFRHVQNVWRRPGEAVAEIEVPPELSGTLQEYFFHPAVLDACFQVFRAARVVSSPAQNDYLFLPSAIRRIRLYADSIPNRLWAHARQVYDDGQSLICDIHAYNDAGERVADILGFRVDPMERKSTKDDVENCIYQFRWEPCRLRGTGADGSCQFAPTAQIAAAAAAKAPPLYAQYQLADYCHDFLPRSRKLICQYVENAFLKLGWRMAVGDVFSFESLAHELGIVRRHHRVAKIQLAVLEEFGFVRSLADDRWEVLRPLEPRQPDAELAALAADYPRLAATEIALSKINGEAAAEILSGEVAATEILFPGGSAKRVGQFYIDGLDFPVHNRLIPVAVAKAIENLPAGRTLRVLEIGAGTGSLTKELLPVLPADRTEYLFTDIGPAFLTTAKTQFADYPFVDYKTFDLEKPAAEQGLAPHGYDIIVASAVLHATEDLRRTLANIRACLADGGLLIFLEPIHRRIGTDIIFGGLPGWWKFTDTDLRPEHALMPRAQWESLLADCGFRQVQSVLSGPSDEESEQAILIAVAPPIETQSSEPAAPPEATATHLVFADAGGFADGMIERLRQAGHRAVRVGLGDHGESGDPDSCWISADAESDLRQLLENAGPVKSITHCWSLDHGSAADLTLEQLQASQRTGVLHALRLIHVLNQGTLNPPPRVYCVTRGVQKAIDTDPSASLASAQLVGLARVANAEHVQWRFTSVDLDAEGSDREVEMLFQEITFGDRELEVAYRGDRRLANRLKRVRHADLPKRMQPAVKPDGKVTPYRLQIEKPGVLDHLSLNETRRPDPGPADIEVRVHAGGINFRDVMKALGMYPGNPVDLKWLGDDFAGTVERVGSQVTRFRVGDRVAGIAPYCFRTYAVTDWRTVFPIPRELSFDGAATLPTVFLTAHYALERLAQLRRGERILIHAATGGVGQAAVQIAQSLGLEIFATAGTPEKRKLLVDSGVPHVMDSRTLDFADQVMDLTQGQGVDAVLNSLAGPFVPKSIGVLAPFGRFLEIGKVDVYGNTKIGLEMLKHNISYYVIDLAECLVRRPEWVAEMFASLAEKFADGTYRPLSHTVFPITEVVEAFRYMAQGKHTGKNVLHFAGVDASIGPCTEEGQLFPSDASYLITGGAGGFGLECAKWMAAQGARHLVLMSRSGPPDPDAQRDIARLRAGGVNVVDARGDVTRTDDVERIVKDIQASLPPLRGILHGAMVLDDGSLADMNDDQFVRAMNPKMLGAWNLHQATRDLPLDHFICFSSFSSVAGGARQGNYNAGNFFLDCLASYRKALGLPAMTVNWGGISGAGFVHRNEKISQYFDKIGFQSFTVPEALRLLRMLLQTDPGQIAAARLNWQNMERFSPFVAASNMYTALTHESSSEAGTSSALPQILAAPPEERLGMVKVLLSEQLAAVCNIDVAKVDHDTSIIRLGLDSLMAIELINRVETELGLVIPMGKVLGGPTLSELSETVVQLLAYAAQDAPGTSGAAATGGSSLALIDSPQEPQGAVPLSERQQTLWFLERWGDGSGVNPIVFAARVQPSLDSQILDEALRIVLQRHPMLTMTYSQVDSTPVQTGVFPTGPICQEIDLSNRSASEAKQAIDAYACRPFDLSNGPAIRLGLFRHADGSQQIVLAAHPLVADHRSIAVVVPELFAVYQQWEGGKAPASLAAQFAYPGFVAWEKNYLSSDASQRALAYWKDQLADAPTSLALPADLPRPDHVTFAGDSLAFQLSDELSQELLLLAAEQDITPQSLLLASFQLFLHGICRQPDLLVGCPLAGRDHEELRNAVGYFGNPVPIRSRIAASMTLLDYLRRTHQLLSEAGQHQQYPLPRLMARLSLPRDLSRWPLCQAGFAMHRHAAQDEQGIAAFLIGCGGHRIRLADRIFEATERSVPLVPAEIMLNMEEAGGILFGCWQFNRQLFSPAAQERIARQFLSLLSAIVRQSSESIQTFQLEGAREPWLAQLPLNAPADRDPVVSEDSAQAGDDAHPLADAIRFVAPQGDTEFRVARLWEDTLGVRPIGARDDFFVLGGHSLDAAALCARLEEMFSVEVPLKVLFADPTVAGLAQYINSQRADDAPPIVDLTEQEFEGDTQLAPEIVAPENRDFAFDDMERVLLTGATGFLGAFLLDELLRQTGAEIVCLVRASSPRHALQRIQKNMEKYGLELGEAADRVIPLLGDLSRPRLGLSPEQFDQLASEIDVIYHNGAVLNFAYPYRVLRDSNVCGTHEVLRLAFQTRLKPTHYVSTVAVLASTDRQPWDIAREDDPLPPFTSLRDAYSQTKWVSEKLMIAAKERGLPVAIYRPGGITGHSETGHSNTGDLVHVMALGCYHLGTIPHLDIEFNLSPVDYIAAAMVELSRRRSCLGRIFHLVNPQSLRLETLVNWVNQSDLPVERMSYDHWAKQVAAHVEALPSDVFGLLTKSFMPGVLTGDMNEAIPAVLKLRYDSQHTTAELANTGLKCRRVDDDLLSLYFSHLRRYGLVLASEGGEDSLT